MTSQEPILDTHIVAPTAPAPETCRFSVGGVLSRTMRVWWTHVIVFTGMSLVASAPMVAFLVVPWLAFERSAADRPPRNLLTVGAAMFLAWVLTVILQVIQAGAVTYGTVRHLHGERARVGEMLGVGLRRGLPVVATGFLVWLGILVGMFFLVVPGVAFAVAASLSLPAAVVERPGVTGAISRSFALTRGQRWPLFAAFLVLLAVVWGLSAAVQLGASALTSALLRPGGAFTAAILVTQLGNALVAVIPFVAVAVAYHDLRVTKEGADTAELARVFE